MDTMVIGAGGTVGSAFCSQFHCGEVQTWDRRRFDLRNDRALRQGLEASRPRYLFNFSVAAGPDAPFINTELPVKLAQYSQEFGYRLIHTSSVMVFDDDVEGPITEETSPNAREGYGLQKRLAEEGITAANSDAIVLRLGWQIGERAGSNNMIDFLETQAKRGMIRASRRWLPACSTLHQTARALQHCRELPAGIYNWNTNRGLSFYQLVHALAVKLDRMQWRIGADDAYQRNQLMVDSRLQAPCLESALELKVVR